jgi:hypothetical protein
MGYCEVLVGTKNTEAKIAFGIGVLHDEAQTNNFLGIIFLYKIGIISTIVESDNMQPHMYWNIF